MDSSFRWNDGYDVVARRPGPGLSRG